METPVARVKIFKEAEHVKSSEVSSRLSYRVYGQTSLTHATPNTPRKRSNMLGINERPIQASTLLGIMKHSGTSVEQIRKTVKLNFLGEALKFNERVSLLAMTLKRRNTDSILMVWELAMIVLPPGRASSLLSQRAFSRRAPLGARK